jgi:hypothetical protein
LIMNKSSVWFILRFIVLGAFIVLVNAALERSNDNAMEAVIMAGGIILFISLSLFVIKNKRTVVLLFLLFGSVCSAYLYHATPEAKEVTQAAIEKGVELYGEVNKFVQ